MKKLSMSTLLCPALMVFLPATVFPQNADNGEVWEPVPVLVSGVMDGTIPSDAIVLFDGFNLDAWHNAETEQAAQWDIADGAVTVNRGAGTIKTRQAFADIQLHVEWRATDVIQGNGQGRGNSGIFLQSLYEVQVLDSWDNATYVNGQAGSVYKQHAPLVNASRKPGEWQTYDIVFTAPHFDSNGVLISPAYVTLLHNGVLVLNHVEILGATFTPTPEYAASCAPYAQTRVQDCSGKMPISLQDHGQVVSYRNIWLREI